MIPMRTLAIILAFASLTLAQQKTDKPAAPPPAVAPSDAQPQGAPASSAVPEIGAGMGNCTVAFKITNLAGDGVYDAKITTTIRHGFMNKRRLDLEIGTNAGGQARFIQLPNEVKNPLVFRVRVSEENARYTWDPGNDCHASYTVPLKVGSSNNAR